MTADALSCRQAVEQLWAYIDGELQSIESERVHEHLAACHQCWPHYDFQKAFLDFVRRQAEQPIPPDLRRRVFLRLLAEEAREASDSG
jgi:anti-sigma factor (TIGR02949 family)